MTEERYSVPLTTDEMESLISLYDKTAYDRFVVRGAIDVIEDVYFQCLGLENESREKRNKLNDSHDCELSKLLSNQSRIKQIFTEVIDETLKTRMEEIDEQIKKIIERLSGNSNDESRNDWQNDEQLSVLEIKSPPDWRDYDAYLMEGGSLEYEAWRNHKKVNDDAIEYPNW